MKIILKIIAWAQTILGSFFIVIPIGFIIYLLLPVIYKWSSLTTIEKAELPILLVFIIPAILVIALAIPQFIVGLSSVLRRYYSKKILIPILIFLVQFYFLMEIFAPVKTVPVFSGENTAFRNEIGYCMFVALFIFNTIVAVILSRYFYKSRFPKTD